MYTSSASTVVFNDKGLVVLDENEWSDVGFIRSLNLFGASYLISKTQTEQAALGFAEEHGLDLVTVVPTFINGPFVCPRLPGSVYTSMALFFGTCCFALVTFLCLHFARIVVLLKLVDSSIVK